MPPCSKFSRVQIMTQPSQLAEKSRSIGPLSVAPVLYDFLDKEVFPGTQVSAEAFWKGLAELLRDLTPLNQALLGKRDELQTQIRRLASAASRPHI